MFRLFYINILQKYHYFLEVYMVLTNGNWHYITAK